MHYQQKGPRARMILQVSGRWVRVTSILIVPVLLALTVVPRRARRHRKSVTVPEECNVA